MAKQDSRELQPIGSDVSASEAASYVFCAKAWHLEHVLGAEPSAAASARRTSGTEAHAAHGTNIQTSTRVSSLLVRALIVLLVAALALLVLGIALASR